MPNVLEYFQTLSLLVSRNLCEVWERILTPLKSLILKLESVTECSKILPQALGQSNLTKNFQTLYSIDIRFDPQQQTVFENIVGKGEIACNKQFLLFPQCFLLNQVNVSPFVHIFDIISLLPAELQRA